MPPKGFTSITVKENVKKRFDLLKIKLRKVDLSDSDFLDYILKNYFGV